jgi:preflagellin peptidase FlaK
MEIELTIARTIVPLGFLIYSSWNDYKTREVSNRVWMLFAPVAFTLTFLTLFIYEPTQLLLYGVCFGLTSAFALVLFYAGGFGGADAKALMCMALALPFYPQSLKLPLADQASPISSYFFPVTVFSNGVFFAVMFAVGMFLNNMVRRKRTAELFDQKYEKGTIGRKIITLVTGTKVSLETLKTKWYWYPMEDVEKIDGELKKKLLVFPKDEGRQAVVERLQKAADEGDIKDKVWASPGLPMLIFITIGFIVALGFGDIIWTLVRLLLH